MIPKRPSLPRPPQAEAIIRKVRDNAGADLAEVYSTEINDLLRRVDQLTAEATEAICGAVDDTQDVERYDGSLGVTRAFVDTFAPPVGQLKWRDDLAARFSGPADSVGDVTGKRWASGGLVSRDLFLTAGHAFDQNDGSWNFPRRAGTLIAPPEIALSMEVSFEHQVDGSSPDGLLRTDVRFPVAQLVEYRIGGIDYAVVRLGPDATGALPGDRFGRLRLAPPGTVSPGDMLCLIQHPNGEPKRIEAGPARTVDTGLITYNGIDTSGGSSGAPLLASPSGEVVGVHTNGGCTHISGANFGVTIGIVRSVSRLLTALTDEPTDMPPTRPADPDPTDGEDGLRARLARLDRVYAAMHDALSPHDT